MASASNGVYKLISDSSICFVNATFEIEEFPSKELPYIPPAAINKANICAQKLLNSNKLDPDPFQIQIRVAGKESRAKFFGLLGAITTVKYTIQVIQRKKPVSMATQDIIELANTFFQNCALPDNCILTLFFK